MSIQEPKFSNIDDYISNFPIPVQQRLLQLRQVVIDEAPDATEQIRYDMPSFKLGEELIVHFAAFKNHIGVYGISIEELKPELLPYLQEKGTIQFKHDQEFPINLFRKLVNYRIQKEILSK